MQNSPKIKALINQIESGKMESDKARILNFIIRFPYSNTKLIQRYLKLSHETASARLSGLQDLGVIDARTTGMYSEFFFVENQESREKLALARKTQKFEKWKKKAKEFGGILNRHELSFIEYLKPEPLHDY